MISRLSCNIKGLITSLLVIFCFPVFLFSQGKINGIINDYGRVTSVGTDFVIVDNIAEYSKFEVEDTVLLLQMKGVKSQIPEDGNYGNFQISAGTPGAYEFLIIQTKEDGIRKITFRNSIVNAYDVLGLVQIVRVPSFYSAEVDAELTSAPWDSISKTGGVLTMIVGTKLSMKANINVLGKGFAGGSPVSGPGDCIDLDPVNRNKFFYPNDYTNSGLKGESHVFRAYIGPLDEPIFPDYAKGKGANYTGGGGGNGHFSGGGGGSLRGAGGNGGDERSGVCAPEPGGIGGKSSRINFPTSGIYLGGGGGGSTYTTGTASAGGNGGGIIIILCETLDGNGHSIIADGQTPAQATGEAGSGGGGAGGSIALYLQSFTTTALTISAKGGNGGNSNGPLTGGTGGGGGGGFINISHISIPANITRNSSGGNPGMRAGISSDNATAGEIGDTLSVFVPVLNGFLFNTIKSSITLNQIDSICSNVIPKKLLGTLPVGGLGNYTYTWQKTYHIPATPSDIGSSTLLIDYSPSVMETATDSVFFRRIVKDNSTLLEDISKWVAIKVQPEITKNDIGKDTIICFNQDPLSLLSLNGLPENGNSFYSYRWLKNNNTDWVTSPDTSFAGNGENYNPPALTAAAYYKRRVISGRCIDYSNTVTISVLPTITGNIFSSPPDAIICEGSKFNILAVTAAGGGDLLYRYQWQDSTISGSWMPAQGLNTLVNYEPDTSMFTLANEKRYYRRLVLSGAYDVCSNLSAPILLTRYHKIRDNIISGPQIICEGSVPSLLTGFQPLGGAGAGTYTYSWQDSTVSGVWSNKAITSDYQSDILTVTRWYRRKVESSVCKSTSAQVLISVQPSIRNNTISLLSGLMDSTICSGAQPYRIIGKVPPVLTGGTGTGYTYSWKSSLNDVDWNDISVSTSNYQPPTLNSPVWYKRVVISASGICRDSNNSVRINVLSPIVNTIPADREVCINTASAPVEGLNLSGGEPGNYLFLWQDSTINHNWTDITTEKNEDITLPLLSDPVKYRRKVWSGPNNTCFNISNPVRVSITSLPYPVVAGKDTLLSTFEYLYNLRAVQPVSGTGTWNVVSSSGTPAFDNESMHNTVVRNLSPGLNTLSWKVVNGVCELVSIINIEIINISIPSGISPDGNGKNDALNIKGLDFSIDNATGKPNQFIELTILNSAGAQVYYTSNTEGNEWQPWEGRNSGRAELPEGTYYYLLTISSNRTTVKPEKRSGFIMLKRY